jgi:O-antigen ligase
MFETAYRCKNMDVVPRSLYRGSLGLKLLASGLAIVSAIFIGLLGATAGWVGHIILVSLILPAAILFVNYRFALLLLVLLLPYSDARFWPKVGPLSVINLLLLGAIGMHLLQRFLDSIGDKGFEPILPKEFVFLYWLPVTIGFVIGSLHLHEIPQYFVSVEEEVADQRFYWVTLYFKGMLFPVAAFILANCVREQKYGRRIVYLCLASGVLFVVVGVFGWMASGISLEQAVFSRSMFRFTGKDPNYVGFLLLPLIGVSVYLHGAIVGKLRRTVLLVVSFILVSGLVITGSRAGLLGLIFLFLYILVSSRSIKTLLISCVVAVGAFVATPDAVISRLSMGVAETMEDRTVVVKGDQLSSGRMYVYSQVIEEVIEDPVFGGGITSMRWSSLVKSGYLLYHAHSMYMSILLDLGVLGTIAMVAFAIAFFRSWGKLARSDDIDPIMRMYFMGLRAGFVGFLGCAVGTGDAYPTTHQWFLWVGIAMAFRYRSFLPAEKVASPVRVNSSSQ